MLDSAVVVVLDSVVVVVSNNVVVSVGVISISVASPPNIIGVLSIYVGVLILEINELILEINELILEIDELILSYRVVVVSIVVVGTILKICCSFTGTPVAAAICFFRSIIKPVDFTVNLNTVPSLRIILTVNV